MNYFLLYLIILVTPQPPASVQTTNKANAQVNSIASTTAYHNVQNYIKELEISEGQLSSCLKYA